MPLPTLSPAALQLARSAPPSQLPARPRPAGHLLLACVLAVPPLGRPSFRRLQASLPPRLQVLRMPAPFLGASPAHLWEPSALRPRCVGFLHTRAYHRLSLSSAAFILFIVDLPPVRMQAASCRALSLLAPPSAVSVELRIALSKRRPSVNVYRGNEFLEHHSRR